MATNLQDMKRQGGAVANQTDDPFKAKLALMQARKNMLGAGASQSLVIDREIRAASVILMNSKDVRESTPDSFYSALSIAVNSGIGLCNNRGYLVAYKGKCAFVPGWKGLVDLVARTNRGLVWTGVVYKGDKFDYQLGDDPFVRHHPEGDSDNWKEATHIYAIGRIKEQDYPIIEVWTINKVIKHLTKYNKVGSSHYALKDDNNMEMYARKVALLQVIKYMPQSQDLETAVLAEEAAETGRGMIIEGNFSYIDDPQNMPPEPPAQHADPHPQQQAAAGGYGAPVDDSPMYGERGAPAGAAPTDSGAPAASKLEAFKKRLRESNDADMLDADADLIKTYPVDDQDDLKEIYHARRAELSGDKPPVARRAARAQSSLNME